MRYGKRWVGIGATCLVGALAGVAQAAPPDWSRVPAKQIPLFYPGPAGLEWVLNPAQHSGARKLLANKQGCFDCHEYDADKIGEDVVAGKPVGKARAVIDPAVPKGRVGTFPLSVQASHDDKKIYLRFEWESPADDGAPRLDPEHEVKLTVLLDNQRVEGAELNGCWASCHMDLRSMPDASPDARRHKQAAALGWQDGVTKYLGESRRALSVEQKPRGGWNKLRPRAEVARALKEGRFLDLMQFRSGKGRQALDGYVLERRHMDGGKSLLKATGERQGRKWSVTFERLLTGAGVGDHTIAAGRPLTFGIAIHEHHGAARHHYVSLGYTLGLDDAAAYVDAKQITDPPTASMAATSTPVVR